MHAQTSPFFAIECELLPPENPECGEDGEVFRVAGTVSAGDGSSLAGVQLNIAYTSPLSGGGDGTVNFQTTVQSNNTFELETLAEPPMGELWDAPPRSIVVTFVDQGTYGDAFCSDADDCSKVEVKDGP